MKKTIMRKNNNRGITKYILRLSCMDIVCVADARRTLEKMNGALDIKWETKDMNLKYESEVVAREICSLCLAFLKKIKTVANLQNYNSLLR